MSHLRLVQTDAAEVDDECCDDRPGVMVECNWADACTAYNTLRELITPMVLGEEKHAEFAAALEKAMAFTDTIKVDRGPYRGGVQAHDGMLNEPPEGSWL